MQPLDGMDSFEPARSDLNLVQRIALFLVRESKAPLKTQFLSPQRCVFSGKKGLATIDMLVLQAPRDLAAFELELRKIITSRKPNSLDIVVVGGGDEVAECMRRAKPRMLPMGTGLIHVADNLALWSPTSLLAEKLLKPAKSELEAHAFDAASWTKLDEDTRTERASAHAEGQELQHFVTRIRQRKPIATYAIAVAIGLVYLMQMYVGVDATPALMRMGALSAQRVAEGEWWRLLTCTFLHGGFLHVLFNVYVLIILGTFIERILGPARLLLLYFVSALLGSVGSVLFLGQGFSVGASGAVWGMLGAHAVLAFRQNTLLPAAMIPGARKAAAINLGINLLNSFRPHVDMWAHFFGGGAGALLLLSGLITRGLTKARVAAGDANTPDPGVPTPTWVKAAAGFSVVVMCAALAVGLTVSNPLALKSAPQFERRALPDLGVELELPVGLEVGGTENATALIGDLLSDPMTIGVFKAEVGPIDPAQMDAELTQLEGAIEGPEGTTLDLAPRRFDDGESQGVEARYTSPVGLILELAFVVRTGHIVRIEAYRWPDLASAPAGSAVRIAKSVRVL